MGIQRSQVGISVDEDTLAKIQLTSDAAKATNTDGHTNSCPPLLRKGMIRYWPNSYGENIIWIENHITFHKEQVWAASIGYIPIFGSEISLHRRTEKQMTTETSPIKPNRMIFPEHHKDVYRVNWWSAKEMQSAQQIRYTDYPIKK
ncbi:hypothetical protein E2P81_ATG10068 [Venturia nashicola]|uniref:Uncharacterized protein n=1 Tax=Venturia nashicola TaxID=86259 RepID=A0A4Z1P142_9PEZI|nr:hypothetical protein E6O75_ATG10287 [Venturia nashicola]TLD18246.1 hypothetical protein E2P81_ATG10068 [Venturia nashicola]